MNVAIIFAKQALSLSSVLMVASVAVIVIGGAMVRRTWRDLHEDDDPIRNSDLLAELEKGDAASKMTEAEFRRVRELLIGVKAPDKAKSQSKILRSRPALENEATPIGQQESNPGEARERPEQDSDEPTQIENP